jgi:hypothetical protein
MNNDEPRAGMTFEEMAEIVDQARDGDFYYAQAEREAWREAQRTRATEVLESLRQQLPTKVLAEVEELLSTGYGADCLHCALTGQTPRRV